MFLLSLCPYFLFVCLRILLRVISSLRLDQVVLEQKMDPMANPQPLSTPLGTVSGLNAMNRSSTAVGGAKVGNNISGNSSSGGRGGMPPPAVVGNHFIKQYYGKVLPENPLDLHRFYMDQSTFTHASGCAPEEPVSGVENIKKKITTLGLQDATVDLQFGSVDAHASENGGVLLLVTGAITLRGKAPRQFVQTFFLAMQHQEKDKHNFFVLNDIFRFLDTKSPAVDSLAAVEEHLPQNEVGKENKAASNITTATPSSSDTTAASKVERAGAEPEKVPQDPKSALPLTPPIVTSYKQAAVSSSASPTHSTEWGGAAIPQSPTRVAESSPVVPASPLSPDGGRKTFATLAKSWATSDKDTSVSSPVKLDNYLGSPNETRERLLGWGNDSTTVPINRNQANASSSYTSGGAEEKKGTVTSPLKMRPSTRGSRPINDSSTAETSVSSRRQVGGGETAQVGTSIYVKPVHAGTTEEDLRNVFQQFGEISRIMLKTERNFAFVDFASAEGAIAVLSCKHDLHLPGDGNRPLYIEARRSLGTFASPGGGGGREPQREGGGGGGRRFVDRRVEKGDTHKVGADGERSERVDGSGKFGGPMGSRGGREKGYRGGRVGRGGTGDRVERGDQQFQSRV